MRCRVIFASGWRFPVTVWESLFQALQTSTDIIWEVDYLGPGYLASDHQKTKSILQTGQYDLAIGHSLGFLDILAAKDIQADKYVSLNGFGCFYQTAGNPLGVDQRILRRMQHQLNKQPEHVLDSFLKNCALGIYADSLPAAKEYTDISALRDGLTRLETINKKSFLNNLGTHVLALIASDDQIVAKKMALEHFQQAHCHIVQTSSHALMLTHTDLCCQAILGHINGNDG